MSNSPLVDYVRISPCKTSPRNHDIDTVTVHCVVGQCTVGGFGEWVADPNTRASANYCIDKDGKIGMYVEEKDRSWCSSSSANDNRAITIEVASDKYEPYAVNDKAMARLIDLLVDICTRNPGIGLLKWVDDKSLIGNVAVQNVTVHRWFANKSCPGTYIFTRLPLICEQVNKRLLKGDDLTVSQYTEVMEAIAQINKRLDGQEAAYQATCDKAIEAHIKKLGERQPSAWAYDDLSWVYKERIMNGVGLPDGSITLQPGAYTTREQIATLLHRFYDRFIKPLTRSEEA